MFDYARGVNLVEADASPAPSAASSAIRNDLALNMVTFMPAALMVALTPRYSATCGG